MRCELDHVFIMCTRNAPEADALVRLGLTEGSGNTHPGQGTACRRFFFQNAYLELLWVHDAAAAQQTDVRRLQLWERSSQRRSGACPFGIALRPAGDAASGPPFPTWTYRPAYFPDEVSVDVALDTTLDEPAIFYLGFQRGRARMGQEPDSHAMPVQRITAVTVGTPRAQPRSAACRALETPGLTRFEASDEYLVTLAFDHAARGSGADLRPALPLVVRW